MGLLGERAVERGDVLDLDLVAEGTNGLEAAIAEIQDDLAALVDTGSEAAADELSASITMKIHFAP